MSRLIQAPNERVVENIQRIYERGLTVDALRQAETFAPLKDWAGVTGCVLAARIAVNAGAARLATRLSIRAWRTDNTHPEAQLQFGFQLSERRGPLAAWQAIREWKTRSETSPEERGEMLALQARLASELRDFSTAEKLLDQAEELAANRPWIRLQKSHLLERQDKVEEALELSKIAAALHPHPFYRPGVQTSANLLQLLDRDEEAVQLLKAADASLQNGPVVMQLYGILTETGRWAEADEALSRFVELSPLLEIPLQQWVTAQRSRLSYHLGRRVDAARFARELKDDFHQEFAKRLEADPVEGERRQLGVAFVRQHFKTCAPATLAALGRFWCLPAEHLKLAEAVCYDGTPHWQQREWAEQNGWFVREFRVTHESVIALINRGIPFALSTVEATSAHMQAVVGFDQVRGTILLRDPGQPYTVEVFAGEFLKRYRPFGPHGMVYLPLAESARLENLELPDAEIYDARHRFSLRLQKHDRAAAAEILKTISESHGDHAIVWETRLDLAGYDANASEQILCLDKLLELFPNNAARLLRRFGCMRNAPRHERIDFLERACRTKAADPVLFIELARTLEGDARCLPQAQFWLKKALRLRPMDSKAISVQADLLWESQKRDAATELYRFAANLETFHEHLYQSWFSACRRTRRTDEAVIFLEDRCQRFGARSEQPAMTLAWAWRELEQPLRARDVLAEACRLRPDNGYLWLRSASLAAGLRDLAETTKLLEAAKGKVRNNDWLRAAAEAAEIRLDTKTSLQIAREILELEPLALDAHGSVVRALAKLEGKVAALAHLTAACARFPHHYGLQRMLVDWNRDAGETKAEAATRELLRIDPSDAWARRELAMILAKSSRPDEALREAEAAAQIEPHNTFSYSTLGYIHNQLHHALEARAQLRRAVELSVDNDYALRALLELARTDKERKEELAFIEQQLVQQVVAGDGLLAFLELARPVVEPEALLRGLQLAHKERPDLWHAGAALVSQLGHLGRLDEALVLAGENCERFPHLPRTWLDLAMVHEWRKEPDSEIAAAKQAFEINPAWGRATLALSHALERNGKMDEARETYERALQHSANDAQLHACHAHLLWRQQQPDAAFAAVERALRLNPGYEWAWGLLQDWAANRGETSRAGDLARVLARERPGEMRPWLMLAQMLNGPDTITERLTAVDRALQLEPQAAEAWDLKANLLAGAERFDEAIQVTEAGAKACLIDVYVLRGRRAWIEACRRHWPEAVRLMREVLTENSSYVWGWNQLAHWLVEQGAVEDATAALEQLQRLRPHDSWVSRQLGFLRLKQGDRAAAQKSFATALQITPTDVHAAYNLFDLQLQSADLNGAAETLCVMQLHQPGAATLATEIRWRLRKHEKKAAQAVLEKLCLLPDPDPWPLDAAADAYKRAGQPSRAIKIFKQAIKTGSCNPQVGAAAIRLLLTQTKTVSSVKLFLGFPPGELQRRAAAPLVHGLADAKARLSLRWLLWRRRQVLSRDDAAWGQVGYALSNFNRMKQVADWMSDWRERRGVQLWMLFNLCLALRHLGRYGEADGVVHHALKTWEHREGSADLRLFVAIEDALSGAITSAQEHLKQVSVRQNVGYDLDLLALTKALVEFQQAPEAERCRHFNAVRLELSKRFTAWRLLKVMKDVRRTFRRAGKVFAQNGGGWRARLWFGWNLNWQWLLLPLAPILAAVAIQPPILLGLLLWRFTRKK